MADSNSLRIRGQEVTVMVIVDGVPQAGSFAKITQGRWAPRADLSDTGFLGENEDEPDIQIHGYDLSFTIHEQDNGAVDAVWLPIVQAATAENGPLPVVDIIFFKKYRDRKLPPATLTFAQCKLKLDSQEFGDRKSHATTSFSAKCRKMRSV